MLRNYTPLVNLLALYVQLISDYINLDYNHQQNVKNKSVCEGESDTFDDTCHILTCAQISQKANSHCPSFTPCTAIQRIIAS